jgi:hypothetical protein
MKNNILIYLVVDIRFETYGMSEYIDKILDVDGIKESYLSMYIVAKKP